MIERGSGRTSGLTDWHLMDVGSMWACLQDHETAGHWKQVAGWRKVCDLALTHLSRLKEYRRGLAEAWPPATNAAARAYLGELDQLIDQVQRTHDAAAANYDALAAATRAIGSTRAELKTIHEEYAAKLQQKQAYEATVTDPKAVMGSRVSDPPVTDADLERLNVRARGIMYGLSGELQQAQVMLRQPPPPPARPRRDPSDPGVYGAGSQAPIIPPIVPMPVATSNVAASGKRPVQAVRPVPTPTAPNVGPVLGGAGTGLAPAQVNPGLPGVTPPAPPAPSPGIGLPTTLPPVSGSQTRRGGSGPLRGQAGPLGPPTAGGANGLPHTTPPAPPPRPMPPGGLIGGAPGVGLGQPGVGGTPPRRVNPVGGVIGGGGAGTAPTGAAGTRPGAGRTNPFSGAHGMPPIGGAPGMGTAAPGMGGMPGRTSRGERSKEDSRHWDPDHPWRTDEGVTPVVRPPDEEGPIDPGPAIGFGR